MILVNGAIHTIYNNEYNLREAKTADLVIGQCLNLFLELKHKISNRRYKFKTAEGR